MSLYVKGLQEVQNYSVALLQTDGVVTLTHGRVVARVARTGQHPRRRGQHLAGARHCGKDSHTHWNPTKTHFQIPCPTLGLQMPTIPSIETSAGICNGWDSFVIFGYISVCSCSYGQKMMTMVKRLSSCNAYN